MSIKLLNISKSFNNEVLFKDFNFEIPDGKITCLLGSSGSGKTTLLNIISGLTPFSGAVEGIEGNISFIFQEPRLIESMSVFENLNYVLKQVYKNINERFAVINKYLSLVEMLESKDKYPHQLSGGMAQRTAMARAFCFPSEVLLMDEAFKGLDVALKTRLIKVFLTLLKENNKTVVMVTHDIYEALLLSDSIHLIDGKPATVIYKENVLEDKTTRTLTSANITSIRDRLLSKIL
ncbi:MAG: ABC transporter ATP-binding protein [Clostridia bacterium]